MSRINIFYFRQFFYTKILYINIGENRKGKFLINYFSPINYYTDVNPIIYAYNTGAAFGYRPGNLFGFNFSPLPTFPNYNGINGSLFSFGSSYPVNSFQSILNATNSAVFQTNTGQTYKFGSSNPNFGSITAPKQTSAYNQTKDYVAINNKTIQTATNPSQSTSYNHKKSLDTSELVTTAQKYLGVGESNNGHLKFMINHECRRMDPYNEEWCTDFVTYVTKETYTKQRLRPPFWFGSHDVATLKRQAISHNKFIDTTTKADKGKFISQKIKPGDIVILNQNGASHTGFVTKVHDNGNFETIEGNVGDPGGKGIGVVTKNKYYAGEERLSGFIRLT